jgi:hypothetical protein
VSRVVTLLKYMPGPLRPGRVREMRPERRLSTVRSSFQVGESGAVRGPGPWCEGSPSPYSGCQKWLVVPGAGWLTQLFQLGRLSHLALMSSVPTMRSAMTGVSAVASR